MFRDAKVNIAAAIILAVLVVGGLLGFVFLYDFPENYKAYVTNQNQEGFEFVVEDGYNSNKIKEGNDFKFLIVLDDEYQTSNLVVRVNGVVVNKYESFNYYLVLDVRNDLKIEVTGLIKS